MAKCTWVADRLICGQDNANHLTKIKLWFSLSAVCTLYYWKSFISCKPDCIFKYNKISWNGVWKCQI